ncbi:hypothetical protein [uncultured Erythrobacter sp.]|uniref:hypothetical protein n=1 Tax=uncultured Erythrobacter sp. TaxID=263913 RepID=UPI002606F176|nr:hypothetical protein [uncultured Erythrobacter sp.]
MVEWIPWLLILVGWHQDTPDNQSVVKIEVAVDQEECEAIGARYLGEGEGSDRLSDRYQYRYLCAPMPDRASFNAAVERWQNQLTKAPHPK